MINPITLFTSFTGRISRTWFWLGLIAIAVLSPFSIWTALSENPFQTALPTIRKMGFVGLIWVVALLYPLAALMVKRLHDRGKSGWLALLFYLPAALATLRLFHIQGQWLDQIDYWLGWVIWWVGAAGIWFLVDLGLFGSKKGPNKYGPEPGSV